MNDFYLAVYDNVSSFLSDTGQDVEIFKNDPDLYKEVYRIALYRKCWDAYNNVGFTRKSGATSKAVKVNLAKAFIDRSVDFLIGNPFTVYADDRISRLMNPVLKYINQKANIDLFALELTTGGSILGDGFVKLVWDDDIKSVRFQLLDAEKVFVKYKKSTKNRAELEYAVVCWFGEYRDEELGLLNVLYKEKWEDDNYELAIEWVEKKKQDGWDITAGLFQSRRFDRMNNDDKKEYKSKVIKTEANSLGFIPIVHFRNQITPLADYGRSDLMDLLDINKSLNEASTQYLDNADYHGSPILAIFGAKVGNLKRGANKIWSGLPKDAKIETVGGKTDFPALKNLLDLLMDYAYLVSGIPEASSGLFQNISNTTGVALQVQYLPLIGLTKRKRAAYASGYVQMYEYALKILNNELNLNLEGRVDKFIAALDGLDLVERELAKSDAEETPSESDDFKQEMEDLIADLESAIGKVNYYDVEIKWADYLPKDSLQELQEIREELDAGIESKRGAMKRRGIEDIESKIEEIKREKDAEAEQFAMPSFDKIGEVESFSGEEDLMSTGEKQYSEEKSEEQKSPEVSGGRI